MVDFGGRGAGEKEGPQEREGNRRGVQGVKCCRGCCDEEAEGREGVVGVGAEDDE